jgi:hypothetical protein
VEFVLGNVMSYLLGRPGFRSITHAQFRTRKLVLPLIYNSCAIIVYNCFFFLFGRSLLLKKESKEMHKFQGTKIDVILLTYVHNFFHMKNMYLLQRSWVRIF